MAGRISEKKSGWDRLLKQQNEDSVCRGSLSSIVGLLNRKNMQPINDKDNNRNSNAIPRLLFLLSAKFPAAIPAT